MSFVSAEGLAKPFDPDGQPYAAFGTRVPALRSFRLTNPAPNDREVVLIQVLAGGDSEDLTPGAALQPAAVPDGRLQVALQDASPSGEEFGYHVSHSVLQVPGARRFQIRDVGCVDKCVRKLPADVVSGGGGLLEPPNRRLLALVGFKLFFTGNREHELDRVGVWFDDDELHVALRDKNGDDTFGYLVDFVALPITPNVLFNVTTGIERGSATGLETIPFPTPSHADFLLTGWALNFQNGDHEILDLGVIRRRNNFTVIYRDKNGDDPFDWRVEWAHVAPVLVAGP